MEIVTDKEIYWKSIGQKFWIMIACLLSDSINRIWRHPIICMNCSRSDFKKLIWWEECVSLHIGAWISRTECRQLQKWKESAKQGCPLPLLPVFQSHLSTLSSFPAEYNVHTLSSEGKIGSCDGSYGVYSVLLNSTASSSVQPPLAVTPLNLFLQHWSPFAHPLPLLIPLFRWLLYSAWLCSQSSVKLRNPSIIGR